MTRRDGWAGTVEVQQVYLKIMQTLPSKGLKRQKDKSCGHPGVLGDTALWERHASI